MRHKRQFLFATVLGAAMFLTSVATIPQAGAVAPSDPIPSFSESHGCGEHGVRTPLAAAAVGSRGLPSNHVVHGPWGTWFGRTESQVRNHLVKWTVPMSGGEVRWVHEAALPAFKQVTKNLAAQQADGRYYAVNYAGTRVWRRIGGSYRMSTHSFGTTIDINAPTNGFKTDPSGPRSSWTDMPEWFVQAWRDAGFCWGGDWQTVKDAMHFSWKGPTASGLTDVPSERHLGATAAFTRTLETQQTPLPPTNEESTYTFADFDRDGVADLAEIRPLGNGHAGVTLLTASRKYMACSVNRWSLSGEADEPRYLVNDYEGYGYPDIWSISSQGTSVSLRIHLGSSEYADSTPFAITTTRVPSQFTIGDFNLDGMSDLGVVYGDQIEWLSAATDFTTQIGVSPLPSDWSGNILSGDRNGDLLIDTYIVGDGTLDIVLNGSSAISESMTVAGLGPTVDLSDRDGDGVNDLFSLSGKGKVTMVAGGSGVSSSDYWFREPLARCSGTGSLDNPDAEGDGYPEIAIGTPFEDIGNLTDAGTLTVIHGGSKGPVLSSSELVSQNTYGVKGIAERGDEFGGAIQYGDFNSDGFIDIAVGAPGEALGSRDDAGSVNVFLGRDGGFKWASDTSWNQGTAGITGAVESGDRFGAALAAGDFNNDGYTDLAVGAPDEAIGSKKDAGIVHVLWGTSKGLTSKDDWSVHQGYGSVPGTPEAGDRFGAVLAAGDFNGDGFDDLAIGSPFEDVGTLKDSGYLQVFLGNENGISKSNPYSVHYANLGLVRSDMTDGQFAASLGAGDVNGDGIDDLAVGAPGFRNGDGTVVLLLGSDKGIVGSIAAQVDGYTGSRLGSSTAIGDFDRDGFGDIAMGAPQRKSAKGGVTLLFGASDPATGETRTITQATTGVEGAGEAEDRFGGSLTFVDINADLYADLLVGVPGEDIGSIRDAGAVQIFLGSSGRAIDNDTLFSQSAPGVVGISESGDQFGLR